MKTVAIDLSTRMPETYRGQLMPLGILLFGQLLEDAASGRQIPALPQDEALATWEPAIVKPPKLSG